MITPVIQNNISAQSFAGANLKVEKVLYADFQDYLVKSGNMNLGIVPKNTGINKKFRVSSLVTPLREAFKANSDIRGSFEVGGFVVKEGSPIATVRHYIRKDKVTVEDVEDRVAINLSKLLQPLNKRSKKPRVKGFVQDLADYLNGKIDRKSFDAKYLSENQLQK